MHYKQAIALHSSATVWTGKTTQMLQGQHIKKQIEKQS